MNLQEIKLELKKYLLKYASIKTDNGILEYDGDNLVAGMDVYSTNENGEIKPVADGDYTVEDGKVIVVKDGKVAEIIDPLAEVDGEDSIDAAEETATVEEEVTEEVVDTPTEEKVEETVKLEDVNDAIANLRKEVNELYKLVDSILEKIGESRKEADERLKKLECASLAKEASIAFEEAVVKSSANTGNKHLDNLINSLKK